ncbi:MAG TPA: hypothetical protein VN920_12255 [Pyrinomonadaceae bacterium]|nr:hypothetical protein [Pyrinomonadaceae bacterium]
MRRSLLSTSPVKRDIDKRNRVTTSERTFPTQVSEARCIRKIFAHHDPKVSAGFDAFIVESGILFDGINLALMLFGCVNIKRPACVVAVLGFKLQRRLVFAVQNRGIIMLKTYLSCLISGLLLLGPAAQLAAAGQQKDKQAVTVADVRIEVGKLGVGEKASATITLKNGTKTKGYITRAGEDDFVMRDRKTDKATTVRYADVARVDGHKGHSTAKVVGISAGVGAGVFVGLIFLLFVGRGRG